MTSTWWLPIFWGFLCFVLFFPFLPPSEVLVSLLVKLSAAYLGTLDILAIPFFLCSPLSADSLHTCYSLLDNAQLLETAFGDLGVCLGCVMDRLIGPRYHYWTSCAAAQPRYRDLAGIAMPLKSWTLRYLCRSATCRSSLKQMLKTLDV